MATTIEVKYAELGGAKSFLGNPIGNEKDTADGNGRYRDYEGGSIYWSKDTGAQEIHGSIRKKFLELGWDKNVISLPNTDESIAADGIGRYNTFGKDHDRGIYWTPDTGAHEISGDIYTKWLALGGVKSSLGYPITGEKPTSAPSQGRYSEFQNGAIYWSKPTGAHEVRKEILGLWKKQGGENGLLGFPTSDELPDVAESERYNTFKKEKLTREWKSPGINPPKDHNPQYPIAAMHDRNLSNHTKEGDALVKKGFRMISLSVYGEPKDPLYASVWIQNPEAAKQTAIYKASGAEYQQFYNDQVKKGFYPIIVSALGSGSNTVFAAVFEKTSGPKPFARHGLVSGPVDGPDKKIHDTSTFTYWNRWAKSNNYILRWATVYGSADEPYYAAIWDPNEDNVSWDVVFHGADKKLALNFSGTDSSLLEPGDFQAVFDAQVAQWMRPAFITHAPHGRYIEVYRDDQLGKFVSKIGLTSSEYQAEADKLVKNGNFYPLCVQGAVVNGKTQFAAIFTQRHEARPRQLTVTGQSVPSLYAFDEAMQEFMQNDNVRAGSLAIAKHDKLVYARAFTWAEQGYPVTRPENIFRVGSNSKQFVKLLVLQLAEKGVLSLDDKYIDRVKLTTPVSEMGNKIPQMTIRQMLEHKAGLPPSSGDWDSLLKKINEKLPANQKKQYPLSLADVVNVQVMIDLNDNLIGNFSYSNTGFTMLTLLVEQQYQMHFEQTVQKYISKPIGVKRAVVTGSLLSEMNPLEVRYHSTNPGVKRSAKTPDQPMVPFPYSGNFQTLPGTGGLSMAPADYVKMLSVLFSGKDNVLLKNSTVQAHKHNLDGHYGGMSGAVAYMVRRNDGIAMAVSFNKDFEAPYDIKLNYLAHRLNQIADAVAGKWPNHDLFPLLGIN